MPVHYAHHIVNQAKYFIKYDSCDHDDCSGGNW